MKRGSLFLVVAAVLAGLAALTLLRGFQPEGPQVAADGSSPPRYQLEGVEWTRLDAQGKPRLSFLLTHFAPKKTTAKPSLV